MWGFPMFKARTRRDPPRHQSVGCPSLPICSFWPTAHCKTYHSIPQRPDAHGYGLDDPVTTLHLELPGNHTWPIALSVLQHKTAHSDRRPRPVCREASISASTGITTTRDHGKHLSGTRKHILRDARLWQPPFRAQVLRLQPDL